MKKGKTRDKPAHVLSVSKPPVSPRSNCGPKLKYRNSVHCPVLHLSVSLLLFELSCIHGNLCSPPFLYISIFSVLHIFFNQVRLVLIKVLIIAGKYRGTLLLLKLLYFHSATSSLFAS